MKGASFTSLRRHLAPLLRPLLARCGPLRGLVFRLAGGRRTDCVTHEGMEFNVHPGDLGVTLELLSTGSYEPTTFALLADVLREGDTFVNIGAHVGLFALPAGRWVGSAGRVIAFEPHPGNVALLRSNAAANECGHVEIIESALSDSAGTSTLHECAFNSGDHRLFHRGRGRHGIEVDVTTLDAHLPPGARVDVVLMDVQGAEARVLSGMERVLSENRRITLIWELSPDQLRSAGADPLDLLRGLESMGFAMSIVDDAAGVVEPSNADTILARCPSASYMNVLSQRDG